MYAWDQREQGFLGRKKKASVLQSCVDIFSKIMLCNKIVSSMNLGM
jgi:hypothetical protein